MVGADQKNVGINSRFGGYRAIDRGRVHYILAIPLRYGTHGKAQCLTLLPITEVRAARPTASRLRPIKRRSIDGCRFEI
jgi:hypothetical protein